MQQCFLVAFVFGVIAVAFGLGYATGRFDKGEIKEDEFEKDEKEEFLAWIKRMDKRIDFDLSNQDEGFSELPFLRPSGNDSGGASGTDSIDADY